MRMLQNDDEVTDDGESDGDDGEFSEERELEETFLLEELRSYIPDHERCFAHTLQLVFKDGIKCSAQIKSLLSKASALISHIRSSTTATDVLEGENRAQASNENRWNSQLVMVRSLLKIDQKKLRHIENVCLLPENERRLLEDFVEVMEPF